jgi:tetratricopeptide (TPR) repeat protein
MARAEVLTALNELDEARGSYLHAIELEPGNAEVHAGLASAALLMNEPREALAAADRALELDPRHRRALYFRGQALLLLGNEEEGRRVIEAFAAAEAAAQADERRVREIESINREALEALDAGRRDEAISKLSDATARFPEQQLLWANLAAAYSGSGLHEEAAGTYRQMIDRGIGDAITHLRLSWELEMLGDLEGSAAERAIYESMRRTASSEPAR